MLHQLDFKLTVEKQYKEGIDKMAKLYQVDLLLFFAARAYTLGIDRRRQEI